MHGGVARWGGHRTTPREPHLRALTWQGKRDVRVEDVPDPVLQEPTDAIVRVISTAICGSGLHPYEVLGPFLSPR